MFNKYTIASLKELNIRQKARIMKQMFTWKRLSDQLQKNVLLTNIMVKQESTNALKLSCLFKQTIHKNPE